MAGQYLEEFNADQPALRPKILVSILPAPITWLLDQVIGGNGIEVFASARIFVTAAACVLVAYATFRKAAFWYLYCAELESPQCAHAPKRRAVEVLVSSTVMDIAVNAIASGLVLSGVTSYWMTLGAGYRW